MTSDLRKTGIAGKLTELTLHTDVTRTNHQHLVGTEMNSWRNRCHVAHRAITKVLTAIIAVQRHRRKNKRNRRRGQQMINCDLLLNRHSLRPLPWRNLSCRLIKNDVPACGIRRSRHRQRIDGSLLKSRIQTRQIDHFV